MQAEQRRAIVARIDTLIADATALRADLLRAVESQQAAASGAGSTEDRLLGVADLATRLSISRAAVRQRIGRGTLPQPDFVFAGGELRWNPNTFDRWLESQRRANPRRAAR